MSSSTRAATAVAPPPGAPSSSRTMPALMSACVVVVVAMVAAINLALPELSGSNLRPTSTHLLWIVDAYILVFGGLLIFAGSLADRFGRKGALITGLSLFATGCFVSASAATTLVLVSGRVISGAGAALVMPATLSLLLQVTPPQRKAQAIAGWSAATGAAGALGNLGGGLILQWLPWQGLFLLFGPLALVLAIAVARIAPRGERHPANLDPIGATLLTAAVFALLFGIIEGPEHGWRSSLVLASFAAAVALVAGFTAHALRTSNPLLDPRIFKITRLRTGSIGVTAVFFGLFALFFVNAQYLQYAKGHSPLATGIAILPLPITVIVVSRRSVALAARIGTRTVVTSGMLLLAAGLAAMSFMTAATSYLPYGLALLVIAVGMGLSVPALSTGIVTSLPPDRAGTGSGLNSAVREVGSALGVAVIGTVLTSKFAGGVPAELQGHTDSTSQTLRAARELGSTVHTQTVTAFTDAMAVGFRVVATVVLLSAIVVAAGTRTTHDR
jgi:EmrB/QacA subfamily drug resistance transporter